MTNSNKATHWLGLTKGAVASVMLGLSASFTFAGETAAQDTTVTRLQAGSLSCKGQGGWGAIIASKKTFDCSFVTADQRVKSRYKGTISRVGLDLGFTGETALTWLVFGPAAKVGKDFVAGSLAGDYVGVGGEVSLGLGIGANALVGGGGKQFALQPISVQVQTGVSIAAGVQTLKLEYVGPLE